MTTWTLRFASYKNKDDIFDQVVCGKKTVETRPRNPKSTRDYSTIKAGDTLVFFSLDSGRKIERTVTFIHVYDSVEDMVKNEDEEKIMPGVGSKKQLLQVYDEVKKKWGQDYASRLEEYGIVAIGLI